MRSLLTILGVAGLLLAVSCTSPDPVEESRPATPERSEAEWIVLFDGSSLDGWKGLERPDVPAAWSIQEGVLAFAPGDDRGSLMTREQFDNFELELEWKISPGGNSGVFYHSPESGGAGYILGPEMQILDDSAHADGGNPTTSAGSNYALHPPTEVATRPVGEFNEVRLLVQGSHVEHWMNGKKIVEYELWTPEWQELVKNSKFDKMEGYGTQKKGHIVLQDHGNPVWFRNVRIRRLEPGDGSEQ